MEKLILLSFDLEEFDAPIEFGQGISEEAMFAVPTRGMKSILPMLDRLGIRATFFVTGLFSERNPALIRRVAEKHELASHGLRHSGLRHGDLKRSREMIEDISGSPVRGFRNPRLAPTDPKCVLEAGYMYNSSENPIWLPGRYNNLRSPRRAYFSGELLNIPASASPFFRIPLFWLAFKNFPRVVIWAASWQTLAVDCYLSIYFHPYEFTDLRDFKLPWYMKRLAGPAMARRLESYLLWLRKFGRFATMREFDSLCRQRNGWTAG